MREILEIIEQIGFPIAISLYLLFRFEKSINELSKSVTKLNTLVKKKKDEGKSEK